MSANKESVRIEAGGQEARPARATAGAAAGKSVCWERRGTKVPQRDSAETGAVQRGAAPRIKPAAWQEAAGAPRSNAQARGSPADPR